MTEGLLYNLGAAVVFAVLGVVVFVIAFFLFDRLTPGDLWTEVIKGEHTGPAIVMAGVAIGLSIIIAAAIH
jgi:uncharacterized membrane protein YjfL (UPF0719 family)